MQRYYIEVVNVKTELSVQGVIQHRNIQHFMDTLAGYDLYVPNCLPIAKDFDIADIETVDIAGIIDVNPEELEPIN